MSARMDRVQKSLHEGDEAGRKDPKKAPRRGRFRAAHGLGFPTLLVVLFLTACRPPDAVPLTWNRSFQLRPPATGPVLFENQAVEVTLPDGRIERMLTTVENGPERLAVVASTALGQTIFTATLAKGRATADLRLPMPSGVDPRLLLALVQLAQWPTEEVRKGLPSGLELREDGPMRMLLRKGAPLVVLRRSPGVIDLDAPAHGLKVRITRLEETP